MDASALHEVAKSEKSPYEAKLLADLLNLERVAHPGGHPAASPSASAPPGSIPSGLSPSAASPGGAPSAGHLPIVRPVHKAPAAAHVLVTMRTNCGAGVTVEQTCDPSGAFCFAENFHCCASGDAPPFCPGKVSSAAGRSRGLLAVDCLSLSNDCRLGDAQACAASLESCSSFRSSLHA